MQCICAIWVFSSAVGMNPSDLDLNFIQVHLRGLKSRLKLKMDTPVLLGSIWGPIFFRSSQLCCDSLDSNNVIDHFLFVNITKGLGCHTYIYI